MDGRVPWCKECCDKALVGDNNMLDFDKLKSILRQLDKPFYKDIWLSSERQFQDSHPYVADQDMIYHAVDVFHLYIKNINSLRQFRGHTYETSEKRSFYNNLDNIAIFEQQNPKSIVSQDGEKPTPPPPPPPGRGAPRKEHAIALANSGDGDQQVLINDANFVVTEEIIRLFGENYTKHEYQKMKNKYDKLKQSYIIQTNLHQEALATYVRFKVKEEDATAKGHVDEARKWYDAAQNAADKAKLSPKQLSESDLQKGLNSFSEISQALEQAVDIIEILPKFKNRPADSVDFTIWCYINYARKLKGLPTVDYSEVYRFYDDMKQEYLNQYGDPYGIFADDTTVANRENVKKFITLPTDYAETEE